MDTVSYKTAHLNSAEVKKEWVVLDATDATLGRFSSYVARLIMGKHKASYSPHVDGGDYVIVINASKLRLTGKKWDDKEYITHSGYPGGQRQTTPRQLSKRLGAKMIIEWAVRGMLPKNRLGRRLFTNLFVYDGSEHPHQAQQPKKIDFKQN
jgi:large subunit ribosomal protein L13